ncbi:AraC family transcriptional regulator [Bifidobacterium sp. ESL0732]|uniref:AraC family transcriptional regulator n=1 Tax=Bifidobacterium sp. ESL0732 TaxID=2983222 RepID=UPI0023F6F9A4|nr:AraC family transcriptional regulator [Bifidobacterium sp. ESL0732]WEV64009.1 AraC family transcriptional regulator [Bifidobacterium sp. ESL0732]
MPPIYANNAYLKFEHNQIIDTVNPLTIGSCGSYRLITKPRLNSIWRGRKDFQLLYVNDGCAHFKKNGHEYAAHAGTMVVYEPLETQEYYYTAEEHAAVCWVHFSGTQARSMIEEAGLLKDERRFTQVGVDPEYLVLFEKMIKELQLQRPGFAKITTLTFELLLAQVHRYLTEQCSETNKAMPQYIAKAILYFNEHYPESISIKRYAKENNVSETWFIQNFKDYIGVSPLQYITSLRIKQAKALLEGTDFSIKEIALLVGYGNPMYFSRLFHKETGKTPTEYRDKTVR